MHQKYPLCRVIANQTGNIKGSIQHFLLKQLPTTQSGNIKGSDPSVHLNVRIKLLLFIF